MAYEKTARTNAALTPQLLLDLRRGYGAAAFRHDLSAGATVAILAMPLSMAIAIGSGVDPAKGLVTSVVAGLIVSGLGGCRFQIGGPAAAFIVINAGIAAKHGFGGLLTATFLAGLMLVLAALLRLGIYIKYVPGPVILGFTSAIGVIITVGQIKDFLGLRGDVPAEIVNKISAMWDLRQTLSPSSLAVGVATIAAILGLKAYAPRLPGLLVAVVAASAAVFVLGLDVETIGTRFGGIPSSLPAPSLPDLSWDFILQVLPSAFTVAFLVGVESLLSAVAADAITGTRHQPNNEILAQGIANIASPLFGGLPVTGVIARTGTNIQAGAKTPVAGVLHALIILAVMLLFAPLASYLALPCLAAVLITVAWRLIDYREVVDFTTSAPRDDIIVLATTFLLTIFVDLNVAIGVGVILASLLFMHRMAETPAIAIDIGGGEMAPPVDAAIRTLIFSGPLFYGQSGRMADALESFPDWPRVLILDMCDVPLIDATAIGTLDRIAADCRQRGCRMIVTGLQPQPRTALHRRGFMRTNKVVLAVNGGAAAAKARQLLRQS